MKLKKPQNLNLIVKQAQHLLITNPNPQLLNPLLALLVNSQDAFFLLYNQMLCHPFSHNHYTFTHALKACSSLHARSKGLEIHAHLLKSGHHSDLFIQNSLLHFYLAENDVVSASRVFRSIPSLDVVSWTSMVSGLSKCGFEAEAIAMFSSMDVKPNAATLVSALSACSGLRALKFGKAIHAYGLKSLVDGNVVFDNAMLDMGHLDNKNVGVGTLALLSNLYASSERWDDANKVRKTMRGTGLKKVAGFSWVELEMSTDGLDSNVCVA
ncbi:Tetratricopeptide-like helical domain superfamily [Sesbania bispinosa]|nr:Tetratricopeptide-like helical domain superfamily [Sesbania bispinosa]